MGQLQANAESMRPQRRAFWMRQLHQWHWISSALCLVGLLLFALTGITLNHAGAIEGWSIPEARSFLRELTEHATQREFVHAHVWKQYDLVMWDNRATMHRARRFDRNEVRDMRRTTLAGNAPTIEQLAA